MADCVVTGPKKWGKSHVGEGGLGIFLSSSWSRRNKTHSKRGLEVVRHCPEKKERVTILSYLILSFLARTVTKTLTYDKHKILCVRIIRWAAKQSKVHLRRQLLMRAKDYSQNDRKNYHHKEGDKETYPFLLSVRSRYGP